MSKVRPSFFRRLWTAIAAVVSLWQVPFLYFFPDDAQETRYGHISLASVIAAYLRIFTSSFTRRRRWSKLVQSENTRLPPIQVHLLSFHVRRDDLALYQAACNLDRTDNVPFTYPQCVLVPLSLFVIAHPNFPLPALGAVNTRVVIEQRERLVKGRRYSATCRLAPEFRVARSGVECDLITEVYNPEGLSVWRCTFTIMSFVKPRDPQQQTTPPTGHRLVRSTSLNVDELPDLRREVFHVPRNKGREYARLCSDINPIHMASAGARLFGFKGAIAHGMWATAYCLGVAERAGLMPTCDRVTMDVSFKQPVYLDRPSEFVVRRSDDGRLVLRVRPAGGCGKLSGLAAVVTSGGASCADDEPADNAASLHHDHIKSGKFFLPF